jgi:hypothetical protein
MGFQIRQVTPDDPAYEAVTRLRYAVCAEEEGLDIPGLNHTTQTMADALDADSYILAAFDDSGEPIATIRTTPMHALPPDSAWRPFFGATDFLVPQARQFMIGRLLVSAPHRGSNTWLRLLIESYEHCARSGLDLGFLACRPRQIGMYESVGCRRYKEAAGHAQYGLLVPMVHVLRDLEHARRIRSKLRSRRVSVAHDAELSARFEQHCGAAARPSSVRLMAPADASRMLDELIALKCTAFDGLDRSEVQRTLKRSALIELKTRTTILPPGNKGTELYMILDGQVTVSPSDASAPHPCNELRPGQVFGEASFLWNGKPPFSSAATTLGAARLLCISADDFGALRCAQPDLAWRFLMGLCRALGERLNASPSALALHCLCATEL